MTRVTPIGEASLLVSFAEVISPHTSAQIKIAVDSIKQHFAELVTDLVPSYTTIYIEYQLTHPDALTFEQQLRRHLQQQQDLVAKPIANKVRAIPVYFGVEVALDLICVSEHAGLSTDEVIQRFIQPTYQVYAVGFAPGFAYMGSTPKQLAMPRLATPRAQVPKGSVAIADEQTAIYPDSSPGGWRILGRTPLELLPSAAESVELCVGEQVQFTVIDREQFLQLGGEL